MAPPAGDALVGSAPDDVETRLPWESTDVAALMSGGELHRSPLRAALAAFDAAIVYSRSQPLAEGLERVVARVVACDPSPPQASLHASRWLAKPLRAFGIDATPDPPVHVPSERETAAARPWIDRLPSCFLAIHPGSGSARKNWPFDRFLELAGRLSPDQPWLLVLGPAEEERPLVVSAPDRPGAPASTALGRAVVARVVSLRVLGAVLARAGLYAGNDSGVSHLAAAWGAPALALFGPTDPATWSPLGPRALALGSPSRDVADLTLDEVATAAVSLRSGSH